MKEVQYKGSANSVPRFGITMKDGDVLKLPDEVADQLVREDIGFSFVQKRKKGED